MSDRPTPLTLAVTGLRPRMTIGETMGTPAAHSDAPPMGGSPFVGHILLDVPAADPAFGFKQIARALADIIQASEPRFAVGVFGSWGSGESTLMDAIAARIDTTKAIVFPFNAWRCEREGIPGRWIAPEWLICAQSPGLVISPPAVRNRR